MKRRNAKTLFIALALGAGLFSVNSAHAALTSVLGGQAVYDSDLNVTWLADASLAATNTFDAFRLGGGGLMTWHTAQSWIGAMNATNYLGYNDWRLPTTLQPDASCSNQWWWDHSSSWGYNCTGSEMGHLFYNELGGIAHDSILTTHNTNLALFQNIRSQQYWSGTEDAANTFVAWNFNMGDGGQGVNTENQTLYAWAVRSGQAGVVPEPETYAMLLAGLGLMGFTARRRKNRAA